MNYLMLVCSEDAPPPEGATPIEEGSIERWIDLCGPRRIWGEALHDPSEARTVAVRDGEVIVSDGPFLATKEFIAGFDLLECADLDEAIAIAAAHPVASRRMIELRPFMPGLSYDGIAAGLAAAEQADGALYLHSICVDEPKQEIIDSGAGDRAEAWAERQHAAGVMPYYNALEEPHAATTVRVRGGETLLSDGPFVATKEFLGGICVVRCPSLDAAVAMAAKNEIASFYRIEVREFLTW